MSINDYQRKLLDYEKTVVGFFVKSGNVKNANEKFSTVFGYFYTRGKLTQKELQDLTGYSAGTISTVLNQLLAMGILRRHNIPGTRKKLYEFIRFGSEMMSVISPLIKEYLRNRRRFLKKSDKKLKEIIQRVNELESKGGKRDQINTKIRAKIDRIQTFLEDLTHIIPIMERVAEMFEEEIKKIG